MRRLVAYLLFTCCPLLMLAQDLAYARKVINDLCSEEFAGRGYVKDGSQKAADYIKKEFESAKLLKFTAQGHFQSFGYPVVAFPYSVDLIIDGRVLVPGDEYVLSPGCPITNGVFEFYIVDSAMIDNMALFDKVMKLPMAKTFLVVDALKDKKFVHQDRADKLLKNEVKAKGLVFANQEKFTWGVSTEWEKFPVLYLSKGVLKSYNKLFTLTVESELRSHQAHNVIGYIKGSEYPDSFIVISAHYDHLGMMGKWALFPGANDNASGVAMMLDLMKYYAGKKPKYSIAFMAFAGEEAGLIGSYYYTINPLFPLAQISLMINLDLMGTGDKGMTVVNGELFKEEFQDLQIINATNGYLPVIKARGKAQNSDHYYFTEAGVKAFFFYLMGEYKYYHDVYDTPEALTLSKYNEAFSLTRDFVTEYMDTKR